MGKRRPARPAPRPPRPDAIESHADGDWVVRPLTGASATKPYRCPGCDQIITPATPHLVAWPVDRGSEERRHWHTPCWRARDRRGPSR